MRRRHQLLGSVLVVCGCSTKPATQVVVVLHAEQELRGAATSLRVIVEGPGGVVALDRRDPVARSTVGPIARVPIVPIDGDPTRTFRLDATLGDGESPLARVVVDAGYVADELTEIHAWFEDACVGVLDCGEGRTCVAGACVGACYEPGPIGAERSDPVCGACQRCANRSCEPIADGEACGCPETDRCAAGACVTSKPVDGVFGGDLHTCAGINGDGFYCWGGNRVGQLGTGASATTTPVRVEIGGWSGATAATDHTCVLNHGGERRCWGWNGDGQLGLGVVEGKKYPTPTLAPDGDPQWAEITSGWYHSCGLARDGSAWCWGNNANGAAAAPGGGELASPRRVDDAANWIALAAGGFHSCGLRGDGTVWCWGLNASGELGVGDNAERVMPVQTGCIDSGCIDDWTAIGAGSFHTCAIRASDEMWCWGGGLNGQLGVGPLNQDNALSPVVVKEGGWRAVAGGQSHTCAIREDRGLYCFGRNDHGQLGVGDVSRRDVPARVGDGAYIRMGLGRNHSCAIRDDRTLWCWGRNHVGQLGLGFVSPPDATPIASPRRVCFPPD